MFRDAFIDEMAKIGVWVAGAGSTRLRTPIGAKWNFGKARGEMHPSMKAFDPKAGERTKAPSAQILTDEQKSTRRAGRLAKAESLWKKHQESHPSGPSNPVVPHREAAVATSPVIAAKGGAPHPFRSSSVLSKFRGRSGQIPSGLPSDPGGVISRLADKQQGAKSQQTTPSKAAEEATLRKRRAQREMGKAQPHVASGAPWRSREASEEAMRDLAARPSRPAGGASRASPEADKPAKKGILSRTGSALTHGFNALFPKVQESEKSEEKPKKYKAPPNYGYQPQPTNIKAAV